MPAPVPPPTESTEPSVAAESPVVLPPATESYLRRLPAEAFLIVHNNLERRESPSVTQFFLGDDGFVVRVALQQLLPSLETVPPTLIEQLRSAEMVLTRDRAGLFDAFSVLHGRIPEADANALVPEGTATGEIEAGLRQLGPVPGQEVSMIVLHQEETLAVGPLDQQPTVRRLLGIEDGATRYTADTVRATRRTFSGVDLAASDMTVIVTNTPELSNYFREYFAGENLSPEIVDRFVGLVATVRLGIAVEVAVRVSAEEAFADEIGDQIDELIEGLEGHPAVQEAGAAAALQARRRSEEGDQTVFEVTLEVETAARLLRAVLLPDPAP
ncbi:MAG: hypothetical protein AAGF12_24705 [Myxococcota bacterium]